MPRNNNEIKTADQQRMEVAKTIQDKRFGGKRNPIVDAFIEVLKEDPDIVIEWITDSAVEWQFKPDSDPVKKIAGDIEKLSDMDKYQRREYDKMYKKYEKQAVFKAKKSLGNIGVMKAIMGGD